MASKQPPKEPRRIGKNSRTKYLPKAGETKLESDVEKVARRGKEILRKFLEIQLKQLEIMEVRAGALDKRIALKGEIEKVVLSLEFFESLVPRDKILHWKFLDSSVQTEAGLGQRLQVQGDVFQIYHNFKKMVDHLIFLEREKEIKETDLPYSREFKARVRDAYRNRIFGVTTEPVNQTHEEEENDSEEVDETSAGESEPGN